MDDLSQEITKEVVKSSLKFLEFILKKPMEELGGIITDKIKSERYKCQIKILKDAKQYCEANNIHPKFIPFKLIANLLEYSSWENRQEMQQKWSALLANSLRDETKQDQYFSFVHILNQISPVETKIIDTMYKSSSNGVGQLITTFLPDKAMLFDEQNYQKDKPLPPDDIQVALWNLIRLGCIDYTIQFGNSHNDLYLTSLTLFGIRFYEACN